MVDPILVQLNVLAPINAISSEFRESRPSLIDLIKLTPCIIKLNDPRIQKIDDQWRSLPLATIPDDVLSEV